MLQYQSPERRACRGLVFNEISTETICENVINLTRSELTSYYNELVLQLKISQSFLINNIEKEIQAEYRMDVEETMKQIINLLDKNILPALEVSVSLKSMHYLIVIICICAADQ